MINIKVIITIFFMISIFLVSGCKITPENVDVVANAIQKKYDNVYSYQTRLISTSGKYSKEVVRELKRPDKLKDALLKNGEIVHIQLCNKDTQIGYDASTKSVTATKVINYDCSGKVSQFFNVFDKIKKLFEYDHVIEETEIDGKPVVHLTLSSKDKTHDYWSEGFWFDKSNYQLIKHVYTIMGEEQITNFDDLQLNIDIPDSEFIFEFPGDVKVSIIDAHGGVEVPITKQPPTIPVQPSTDEPSPIQPTGGSIPSPPQIPT